MNATLKPYLYLAIVLAWVASLAAVGWWQNSAGHVAERSAWMDRENKDLRLANAEILRLESEARSQEKRQAELMATISTAYQEQLTHESKQHATDLAALHAGSLRLRDHAAPRVETCASASSPAAAGAARRDGDPGADLSDAAAGFLLGLASEADDIARQLIACQSVIMADRAK